MKHIDYSERLTNAKLNKAESELKEAKEIIRSYKKQFEALNIYISDLKQSKQVLTNQVKYLVEKLKKEWSIA